MSELNKVYRMENMVAIVTGGSMGIGEGIVRVFVREGAKVVFCARGNEAGKKLEEELNSCAGPGESHFIRCDVSIEDDIKNVVEQTVAKYSKIDCLVNNAGIHPPHTDIDNVSADDFRHLLSVNLVSYFLFSKYSLPYLRNMHGSIINDSSLVGMIGQPQATAYVASKGAISAMSRAMAIDEAQYDVRVNTFSPGNVWTPMWDKLSKESGDAQRSIREGADAQLLGRFGTIEEAGQLCLYLATSATFITGVDIPLSGGAELNYGNKNRKNACIGN